MKPFTLWLTGIPSSGKTTLLNHLTAKIPEISKRPFLPLDADRLRGVLWPELTWSREHRDANVKRLSELAVLANAVGVDAGVAAVSPYTAHRLEARQRIEGVGARFIEVFVYCSLEEAKRRDVKGLYAKALAGEILNFTAVGGVYESPMSPEVECHTQSITVEHTVKCILGSIFGKAG